MMMGRAWSILIAAAGISLAVALAAAHGAPLPREECDRLAGERSALMAAGIPEQMAKGPAWAKTSLPAAKLAEIERFIAVDEQLAFRCGMSRIKLEIPDDEQPGDGDTKKPVPPAKGAPAAKKAAPPATPGGAPAAKQPAATPKAAAKAGGPASTPKAPSPVPKSPAAAGKVPVPSSEPTAAEDTAKKAAGAPVVPKPKPKPKPKPPAEPATPTTDPS